MTEYVLEDSPILVTGSLCSGAAWVQRFLSQHPRITVHGQPPEVRWETLWDWYETLQARGQLAGKMNRQAGYEVPCFAGSDPERTAAVYKAMLRQWLCGFAPEKPRWGLVWPGLCAEPVTVEQVETFWPQARWVVCLCHPLKTIELAKATFWPELDIRRAAADWVAACRFLQSKGRKRTCLFQPDRLATYAQRRAAIDSLLNCVGEGTSGQTEEFFRRNPDLNPLKRPRKRTLELTQDALEILAEEVRDLERTMAKMGYAAAEPAAV